jgi:hypothetical protein
MLLIDYVGKMSSLLMAGYSFIAKVNSDINIHLPVNFLGNPETCSCIIIRFPQYIKANHFEHFLPSAKRDKHASTERCKA